MFIQNSSSTFKPFSNVGPGGERPASPDGPLAGAVDRECGRGQRNRCESARTVSVLREHWSIRERAVKQGAEKEDGFGRASISFLPFW